MDSQKLNPQYEQIGKSFVQQYYSLFDDASSRANLAGFYAEDSIMSFEGQQIQGKAKIMEKFNGLSFSRIQHVVSSIDCQPMSDGGVLISVLGQIKTDDDPPHTFSHTFVLSPADGSFYCSREIFRLALQG
jgi:ketosteroid isomerase-like protein